MSALEYLQFHMTTWLLISGTFLFLPVSQPEDSLIVRQAHRQIRHYVEAVRRGNHTAINLWALAAVSRHRPQIQTYLNQYIARQEFNNPALHVFRDTTLSYPALLRTLAFQAESPLLLVTYLLAETDTVTEKSVAKRFANMVGYPTEGEVNYEQIIEVLHNGTVITKAMLPADTSHPLHFFLFWDYAIMSEHIFTKNYLKKAAKNWSFPSNPSLRQSLGIAAHFKIYYYLRKDNKTKQFYNALLHNAAFPVSVRKLHMYRALNYSMYILGYYHRSINIIKNYAVPLASYFNQPETVIKMKIAQGTNFYEIGKFEKSKQIYLDILAQTKTKKAPFSKARVYNNLAVDYWMTGEFERYLNLQFKALQEVDEKDNYKLKLDILLNLVNYHRKNRDLKSAELYLKKAQKMAYRKKDPKALAKINWYKGLLYRDIKSDLIRALSAFKKALTHLSPQKNYTSYHEIQTEIAFLFEEQGKYQKALNRYRQIIERARVRNIERNVLEASIHKANIYLKMGLLDSVKTILDELALRNLSVLNFDHIVKAKTVRAGYWAQTGQPAHAYALLKPVIEQIVKRSRASGDLQTGFWQIEPEYLHTFELLANLLINNNRPEEAVEVLDRLKTINDAELYQNPLTRAQVLNEKELSLYKRLTAKLNNLRKKLLTVNEQQRADIQLQIDKLDARKEALNLKITKQAGMESISVDEVQRQLNAYERVLHITELNDIYYLAIISRTSVQFKKIPLKEQERTLFSSSIAQLAAGNTDLNSLYKITELLGIKELPEHVRKLIVIPDSYLYQLPLGVLPAEPPSYSYSYGSTEYLIEHFQIVYKTSLNDINTVSSDKDWRLDFAGYGVSKFNVNRHTALSPLPRADKEIKMVAKQLTELDGKKMLLNNEATEQSFRRFAPDARILHMATHSTVSGRNPLFSSIYLSRPASDNQKQLQGRIFAYELFELDLDNDLIMLNSCESASGSYLQGTGVVGISRALQYAGAEALVLNVWKVNDMLASEFAVKFYENLNQGQSKSEALQNAKLYFLENNNANPYYWGSYMLLGNAEPLIYPYKRTNRIVAISFMIFFLGIAIASSLLNEWKERTNQH